MNTNKVSMPNKIFGTVVAHSLRGKMLSKTELQTLAESRDIEEDKPLPVLAASLQDAQKLVGIDIDTYNVLAVLRGKYWGLSPADITDLIVTTTTKVSKDTLQKMINTEKIQEAIGELAATNYKDLIPRSAANDIDAIMQLEAGFEKEALKRIMNSFRTVFTIANLLASLKLMGYEIRNLAAIAAGVEQKISADKIMASLVRV